jgi:cytochrome c oxidase subunit IV
MSEHIISNKIYVGIWALLLVLTVVTALVAFVDLGPLNTIVALSIASLKAVVVILYFMHVKYSSEKLTKTVIVSAIFFLMILLGLSLADFTTRVMG